MANQTSSIPVAASTGTAPARSAAGWIALILVVVGALNWGLVGAFQFDLVAAIFGTMSLLSRVIYLLVAASGVYLLVAALMRRH